MCILHSHLLLCVKKSLMTPERTMNQPSPCTYMYHLYHVVAKQRDNKPIDDQEKRSPILSVIKHQAKVWEPLVLI